MSGTGEDRASAGVVVSVNTSERKTVRKPPGQQGRLIKDRGFDGDAHAGDWHRQVSLLAQESIDTMVVKGLDVGSNDRQLFVQLVKGIGDELPVVNRGHGLLLA